ncbi:hypothetical protein DUI87_01647 [Hirundo rustica rustica]|uniref:Uncharacterized protein n=1 Tax=Hirundo rustica rustica TaxID=333673 RepID=A0A3M0L5W9_HIRRU|nr:hypothetical protein DUI87_01647 [Hirundo rustica rustica]
MAMGQDVHKAIQSIRGMVEDIKKETSDWLSGMFGNWGILGWVGSIIKSILSSVPEWEEDIKWEEDMELEEDSEEDRDLEEEPQVE